MSNSLQQLEQRIDHYRTGIDSSDQEHWELVVIIDRIGQACEDQQYQLAMQLLEHYTDHLTSEEQVMCEVGYPYFKSHADHHKDELQYVTQIVESSRYHAISSYTRSELINKIFNHIDFHDIQFAQWMSKQQLF